MDGSVDLRQSVTPLPSVRSPLATAQTHRHTQEEEEEEEEEEACCAPKHRTAAEGRQQGPPTASLSPLSRPPTQLGREVSLGGRSRRGEDVRCLITLDYSLFGMETAADAFLPFPPFFLPQNPPDGRIGGRTAGGRGEGGDAPLSRKGAAPLSTPIWGEGRWAEGGGSSSTSG